MTPIRWQWPGIFSLDVPDGWSVVQQDDRIDISPASPVGAVNISVLSRDRPDPVAEGEATSLATNFALNQQAQLDEVVETDAGWARIARARFTSNDGRGDLYWDIEVVAWPERALICTYCHGDSDVITRRAALEMFRSIRPDE